MTLDETMAATDGEDGEELLLDTAEMTEETPTGETADLPPTGTRSWLTREETAEETAPEPRPAGTLFERMSSIARGAQKAQVPEEEAEETQRLRTGTRDPLDIPRFLNRQNNQ